VTKSVRTLRNIVVAQAESIYLLEKACETQEKTVETLRERIQLLHEQVAILKRRLAEKSAEKKDGLCNYCPRSGKVNGPDNGA
jgi:hypothetical protein